MARPSSIDKLEPELRELIGQLRERGFSIDKIRDKLLELDADISRSALGRHVKGLDELGERLRRSRQVADALVAKLGDAPESKQAQLNIEIMHGMVLEMLRGEDGAGIRLDPESAMLLSRSLQALTSAEKAHGDMVIKVRREIAAEQKAKLDEMEREAKKPGGGKRGFDPETLRRVRQEIYGIPE